ncbi:MAG: hypothetical protein V4724_26690 [Pseudomonadota bacterium]
MSFADNYLHALMSSNLRDDEQHHSTEALVAAALADVHVAGDALGALLSRVKFADGSVSKLFEGGTANLAQLLRIWMVAVAQKGTERKWVKIKAEWDINTAASLYRRVAERSLAYWLNSNCVDCGGTGVAKNRCTCKPCAGTGRAALPIGGFERERTLDMVAELENLIISHNGRAAGRMRRSGANV